MFSHCQASNQPCCEMPDPPGMAHVLEALPAPTNCHVPLRAQREPPWRITISRYRHDFIFLLRVLVPFVLVPLPFDQASATTFHEAGHAHACATSRVITRQHSMVAQLLLACKSTSRGGAKNTTAWTTHRGVGGHLRDGRPPHLYVIGDH